MENDKIEQAHTRRVRYKGTHPKSYKEKYKELQPEKYAETVAKVIEGGGTPAGMHISICVKEILDILQIQPGEIGLDATLGYGGHTVEMLKRLEGKGHIYATDADPIESEKTRERLAKLGYNEQIITICNINFAHIDKAVPKSEMVDFALADLGLSSMQIDNPERGFTYKKEGPLDLRLNPLKGISAAERLKTITLEELRGMLTENADEPYADKIAGAIISKIASGGVIETTTQLKKVIEDTLKFVSGDKRKEIVKKTCQRTFQALRIDVNSEFEVLYELLEKLPSVMKSGGRIAILSFHSGEDRLVKKSFKRLYGQGVYSHISDEVIRPTPEECFSNSRARSAKLRWAIKA